MEDFYSQQNIQQNRPKEESPFEELNVKPGSPEEIVAENVSQQLLSNAFESQKKETQEVEHNLGRGGHTYDQHLVEEPFHQNVDIQSEQRFSGVPLQQYIYDEEEEDEEESDEEEFVKHPLERQRKDEELLAFGASPDTKATETNLFDISSEPQIPAEEVLYQLSDDNVLTAQSYGIKTDLRIDSTSSEPHLQEVSAYELNTEDPFSTPQKHKTETNKESEQEFERFVDKCEPFETIAAEEYKPKESVNLLDFDQSFRRESDMSGSGVPLESHSMVESKSESEPEPNHALNDAFNTIGRDKGSVVVPSSALYTELSESHIQSIPESTNKTDFEFTPTVSPNLDSFEPTVTSSTTHHFEQAFPSAQQKTSTPIETIEESPITSLSKTQSTKAVEPQEEKISSKMTKRESKQEHAVTTSSESNACPFSPSAWFNPNQLSPTVAELVYWRDPKKSGVVFGAGLAILLSLTVFSIISVIAYSSLAALSVTLSFRIYKNILQAVQKTNDGHPFKEYLEIEITPSSERIHEIVDSFVSHMNCTINKLRSVFLVEDIIDSLKFVVLFWCLTYIGSWFNGLTLIILVYLGLFSLPKVYEMNKTQIDQYLSLASTQINDITSKIRAKIPFPAKKDKEN